jgi:hypothetical protein
MTLSKLIAAVIGILIVAVVSVILILPDWPTRGQFGDIFGSVNALFSGLAFAGLYWALHLQQEQLLLQQNQLSLQREELKLQREEMAASRAELANQVKAQQALFRATTAQIVVAATQARIQALNMESLQYAPESRQRHTEQIKAMADALDSLADRVETQGTSS